MGSVMNCPGNKPLLEQMSGGHKLGDVLFGEPGHLVLELLVAEDSEGVVQLLSVEAGGRTSQSPPLPSY